VGFRLGRTLHKLYPVLIAVSTGLPTLRTFSMPGGCGSVAENEPRRNTVKQSAGTLLYREGPSGLEVLIVHPSGPYNRRAPWSIPKGVPDDGETDLAATARRETTEETGVTAGELTELGFIDYTKTRKRVHCFAGPASADATPRVASWEVDQARFVPVDEARRLLHPEQAVFIDRLLQHLGRV
jgi:predicted NUDIX family NTP pyrophosphohydrolase